EATVLNHGAKGGHGQSRKDGKWKDNNKYIILLSGSEEKECKKVDQDDCNNLHDAASQLSCQNNCYGSIWEDDNKYDETKYKEEKCKNVPSEDCSKLSDPFSEASCNSECYDNKGKWKDGKEYIVLLSGSEKRECKKVKDEDCNNLYDSASQLSCQNSCYGSWDDDQTYTETTTETKSSNPKCKDVPGDDCSNLSFDAAREGCEASCYEQSCGEVESGSCGTVAVGQSCGGGTVLSTSCTTPDVCNDVKIDTWSLLLSGSSNVSKVECEADYGLHGDGVDSSKLYPANSNHGGPWRSDDSNAISWTGGGAAGKVYDFYSGNYLSYYNNPAYAGSSETLTRLAVVQRVFNDLLDNLSGVNISVMRFDDNDDDGLEDGGFFIMPMAELTDSNRATYQAAVGDGYSPHTDGIHDNLGWTPLAETLYESYLFWTGGKVHWGDGKPGGTSVTTSAGVSGAPSTGTRDPADSSRYLSPIEYSCQNNFNILLTDGDPTRDTNSDTAIKGLSNFSTLTGSSSCSDTLPSGSDSSCLDDLAEYMFKKDLGAVTDDQVVSTYTIGFDGGNVDLLTATAENSGAAYYPANNYDDLLLAFQSIVQEILTTSSSFASPSVSVNAFNRFSHMDQLYYALFKVDERPEWTGNVKRYKLSGGEVVDVDGVAAVDSATGFFKDSAKSWWSAKADGNVVGSGGAAHQLTTTRNVYTYTAATAPADALLTNGAHRLRSINDAITKSMLGDGTMSDSERLNLLNWASGIDVKDSDVDGASDDARTHMGDPLHSVPLLINYGGTADANKLGLFFGTNEGYLHAIDPSDGSEIFSFVPPELLPNLRTLYNNLKTDDHPYGLDGPISKWHNDLNDNGLLYLGDSLESGESLRIYAAMRRGGRNYYALDVTTVASPRLAWRILGGTGSFKELGQSWSTAKHARIKVNGSGKDVLIFGGGYDPDQDDATIRTVDDQGRAIYIVDAATGAKIWQAGPAGSGDSSNNDPNLVLSAMKYSIPSDITLLDTNRDGYEDRMYVGDMGGQVWRFDIDNDNSGADTLVDGGVIADLGGSGSADARRFYYPPAIAYADHQFYIAIGSGFRAHPLNTTIHDAMFVLKDKQPLIALDYSDGADAGSDPDYLQYFGSAEDSYITLSSGSLTSTNNISGDLFDATSNILGSASGSSLDTAQASLEASAGFYIGLNEVANNSWQGEKVLAKAVVFDYALMFTTFMPSSGTVNVCAPDVGTARYYRVDLLSGKPFDDPDTNEDESEERGNRYIELVKGGIPPEPVIILPPDGGDPIVMIGPEKVAEMDPPNELTRTYWRNAR
ncbi:MAG: hypothetical protein HQL48_08690, partial [Gammaproteobacteria bacterium]|nr:hypothetical protein [Gammaproteobacteria bacterium]